METKPVLIVGAGPVGLSAAAWLSHFNVPVKIIDSNSGPTTLSKALVLWRRTLITINPLIPLSYWLTVGTPAQKAFFANAGRIVASLDVSRAPPALLTPSVPNGMPPPPAAAVTEKMNAIQDHSNHHHHHHQQQQQGGKSHEFPAGLLVPQSAVESAFVHLLHDKHNISVQRNTTLTSFTVNSNTEVHCELSDGTNFTAAFVIGCDGARSTVRKQLGETFQGSTLTQRWFLADVGYKVEQGINPNKSQNPVEQDLPPCCVFVTTSSIGTFGVIPLGIEEGKTRVIWHAGKSE